MIELNCSYEESKKILELGYDFSPVCIKFDGGEIQPYFGVLSYDLDGGYCIALRQFYDPETFIIKQDTQLKDCFTPIIPKAALEACLPDYLRYEDKHTWAGHTSICLAYGTGEDLTIENYTTEHESAFEAFMWCHEYYPEELKRKFDEVMA